MFRKTVLENGIRVVSESIPTTRSVSIGVLIDAGPQNDPPGQQGLAHLTEHSLFQGTSTRSAVDISRLMDAAGGQMGAFTARDYTCLYANVLDDYSTYALDLLGDILLNSTYPEAHLEREKQAILREIDLHRDTPSDRLHSLLKQSSWPDHPLGRSILGTQETVRTATREDIIYFVQENYRPDRIIIACAGNLDHDIFVEQTIDACWRMLGESDPSVQRPCIFQPAIAVETAPVSQAYFALGIETFPYAHSQRYLLHVLNAILGGGMSSRLFRQLREERGLVYNIQSEIHAYQAGGQLVIEGSTAPEQLTAVLALTIVALYRLATGDEPIDEEELYTAKMQIRGQHLLSAEHTHTLMSRLATQEFYFRRNIPEEEILQKIEQIEVADLQQFAGEQLTPALGQMSLAVIGPERPACYSTATLRELMAEFQEIPV